ncbi:MAG TPA: TonB family protein [Steroidobacteraceae bacterium]|nr:TonB family protein [Steroidobacteraceae bacterium]
MSHSFASALHLPRRTLVLAAIITLHLTVAYFFATGLIQQIVPAAEPHTTGVVLIEREAPELPPPPSPHKPVWHPQRVTPIPTEFPGAAAGPAPITAEPEAPPQPAGAAPAPEPQIRLLGQHRLPASEDFYPPEKRREGIEGAPIVRVCVDERGMRAGEPVLESSSGDAGLDQGAVNVARHGHYARAERGGVPVANCYRFRISFQIR